MGYKLNPTLRGLALEGLEQEGGQPIRAKQSVKLVNWRVYVP